MFDQTDVLLKLDQPGYVRSGTFFWPFFVGEEG